MIKKFIPVFIAAVMLMSIMSAINVIAAPQRAQILGDKFAPYGTLQGAIDAAQPGKTITITDGQLVENVVVNKAITITSVNGPSKTSVSASDTAAPVFTVTANDVKINGFTIQNGAYKGSAGVFLSNVVNCEVSNNVFNRNWFGVHLASSHCTVTGNYAKENGIAIYLGGADSNVISANTATGNDHGIYVDTGNGNTITNNVATNNVGGGLFPIFETKGDGIWMMNANSNTVTYNTLNNNDAIGITLYKSSNNVVGSNKMESNTWWGIRLRESSGNVVTRNTVSSNGIFNLNLVEANNNQIYLNNFVNQVTNFGGTNSFSTPEKMTYGYNGKQFVNYLGNYWSGYSGTDANNDGIGDTPYFYDNYPLMTLAENYLKVPPPPQPPIVNITRAQLVPGYPANFEWVIINTGDSDAAVAPVALIYNKTNATPALEVNATGLYVFDGATVTKTVAYQGYGWAKVPAHKTITIYSAEVVPLDAKWAAYNMAVYDNKGGIYWHFPNWDKYAILR
jgi:nitrous oxidase accessory protein